MLKYLFNLQNKKALMKYWWYLEKSLFLIKDSIIGRYLKRTGRIENVSLDIDLKVKERLSELDKDFLKHWKARDKDLTVVILGDSLSTIRADYSTARSDASLRPPLMISYAYPTYIEELLRWEGQEYKRFDVDGVFIESCMIANTKEVDPAWDWYNTGDTETQQKRRVNRPSITRILEGVNCSVSYKIPSEAIRCDFIYRTDYLNTKISNVAINKGDGYVEAFDYVSKQWVEANGYTFSMKEVDKVFKFINGNNYRESIYQKRLKMRTVTTKNDEPIIVKVTNDGEGRLTYWGIQHSPNEYFIDFLANARGSHSIAKLRCFERVDVDVFEPNLILKQNCTNNEVITVAKEDGTPINKKENTPNAMANRFLNYINELESKSYRPTVVNYTLFHSWYTNWLSKVDDTVFNCHSDDGDFTGFDYHNFIDSYLSKKGK